MFRDFCLQDKKYILRNYLKRLKTVKRKINKEYDIPFSMMEFLLWGYDLQFFTIDDHLFRDETKMNYRVRYALTQRARLIVQRIYKELEG